MGDGKDCQKERCADNVSLPFMQKIASRFVVLFVILLSQARGAQRPNVLFIMADDYRPELGCYGSKAITPALDRLAGKGVRFEHAYAQQAMCNPSRSSYLTGLRPDTLRLWCNGTHFRQDNPDVVTMPQLFMKNGYTARCVGKVFHNWHTTPKGDRPSWSADEFLHYANHADDRPMVKGELPPNVATLTTGKYNDTAPLCECRDVPDEAYYDGRVAAEAIRVLNEQSEAQPFFLAVGMWKPHAPFNAPKKYWDLYERDKLPLLNPSRPTNAPDIAFHQSTEILGAVGTQFVPSPEQAAEMRHGYFASISYLDAQVGKVLEALKKHPAAANTIVIFIADHGYHIGEHTLWGKTSNFEYDAHVPMIILDPRIPNDKGRAVSGMAELLDLYPTLVDLCDLQNAPKLEGTSLAPVLRDPAKPAKSAAFTQHPRPAYYDRTPAKVPTHMGYSVSTAHVRYTEWRDWKTGEVTGRELYDHATDPEELRNVIDQASLAKPQAEAMALIKGQFPLHMER